MATRKAKKPAVPLWTVMAIIGAIILIGIVLVLKGHKTAGTILEGVDLVSLISLLLYGLRR
jgi:hypothetical protein